VFFVLVGFLVGIYMNWRTLGVTKLSGKAAGIVSISCVQIFLGQQMLLIAGVYRSARQNPRCGLLGSIGSAFFLITAIGSLAVSRDPLQFAIVNAGSRAIFLFVMLLDARKILPEFTLSISGVRLRAVQPYIIPGFGHAAMPLINALQNEGMILVLAVFLGPASVAIFQTTRTAVNGAKSAMGLAATAVMVEIPFLIGDRRMDSIRQLLIMNTQVALVAAIGWLVVLGVFGQFIFRIWLHNRTVYSPSLTLILLASIFPFAIANTYTVVLLATNKIHRAVALILPAALISLAVTAAGAYLFGLNGAATGVVTFETLSLLAVCAVTAKHTGIRVRETLIEAASRQSITANYRSALSVLRLTRV
jgi:O-antigen/teichoic acid export membrane protein